MTPEELIEDLAIKARGVGLCGEIGPVPGPGMLSYLCTLPVSHTGAHVAKDIEGSTIYDSWVK